MKQTKSIKKSILTIITAIMLAMSAGIALADGSDPLDPSDGGADWDGDGLTNSEEQTHGTNMNNADSDGDGLPDGWEVSNGLNPTNGGDANADPDGDGLTNAQEYAQGTNPNNSDTDGDGKPDNTDQFPTDPNDGEYSDSDGDGIPDAYDPDFSESDAGSGNGGTEGGGESDAGGEGQGEGQGEGEGDGDGKPQGRPSGAGGNTSSQGSGSGSGQGEGSGSGSGSGSGEGQGESGGQGEGSGSGEGSGEGQGEGEGEGEGDSDSGEPGSQPGPDLPGEATGGPQSDSDGPSNLEEILEELQKEQDKREQEVSNDNMEPPMPIDDDSTPPEPSDTPSDTPGPFDDLSDEEIERLIEEIKEALKKAKEEEEARERGESGEEGTGVPQTGNNPVGPQPSMNPTNNPELDRQQSWQWLNLGSGSYGVSPTRIGSDWTHMLWIEGMVNQEILTFGGIMDVMRANGINFDSFRPTPAEAYLEFPDFQTYSAAQALTTQICDEYVLYELDNATNTIIYTYDISYSGDGPENRWVPENTQTEDLQDTTGDDARQQIDDIIEQMRQDTELARDRDIPTGYGEGGDNQFLEEQGVESNAARQENARNAGADAGIQQANEDTEDKAKNTQSARQGAQSAANATERASNAGDETAAAESAVQAVDEAKRAAANADPSSETDQREVDRAVTAAQEALQTAASLNPDLQEIMDEVSDEISDMPLGQGKSESEIFADDAVEASQNAQQAAQEENVQDAAMSAVEAIASAQSAREVAVEGDITDRQAVDLAITAAQDAVNAAAEAGWEDAGAWEQSLDNIEPFSDMGEAAREAEARKRDTMPGEFADSNNPNVAEDMLAVAEEAVRNAIRAMESANPAFEPDARGIQYILEQTEQTLSNAGNWGVSNEDLATLQSDLNGAIQEYKNREYSLAAVWQGESDCWYRDTTGKILVFTNSNLAQIWAAQNGLITDPRVLGRLPEDWETIDASPTARREN